MEDIRVESAITLCHVVKEYESFIEDVKSFMNKENKNTYFLEDLRKVSIVKNTFGKRKIKNFYKSHQGIIDTINRHSRIDTFLFEVLYDRVNKGSAEASMHTLYEYFLKNETDKEQILILLSHIRALGFDYIRFLENVDFTKEKYAISPVPIENFLNDLGYLENLERIPSFGKAKIKYKSNGSHFKIKFSYSHLSRKFLMDNTIYLNSLLFSPSLLPSAPCLPSNLFKEIVSLKEEKQEECEGITDAVNLKIKLTDLEKELRSVKAMLNNLSRVEAKEKLENSLRYMEVELLRMTQLSSEYDKSLVSPESSITEEILKRERNIRKSILENIDLD